MPVFFLSNASVEKVNLLGTIINLQNPSIIKWAIAVLFGYFLWRYYIYRREDVRLKVLEDQKIMAIGDAELKYFKKKTRKYIGNHDKALHDAAKRKDFFVGFSPQKNPDTGQDQVIRSILIDKKINFFTREREIEIYGPALEDLFTKNIYSELKPHDTKLNEDSLQKWKPVEPSKDLRLQSGINYNVFIVFFLRRFVSLRYAINQSYFSDYNLPFLVALTSVAITSYSLFT